MKKSLARGNSLMGWSDKKIEERKKSGLLKPPLQKVPHVSERDEADQEYRFQEKAVLEQLALLQAAREKLAKIDGVKLSEPDHLQMLFLKIAEAMSQALFRSVMTYVYANDNKNGFIETVEVRDAFGMADPFVIFDDPELSVFLDRCRLQPTLAELRARGVRMEKMPGWDSYLLVELVEGEPANDTVSASATCQIPFSEGTR